MASQRPAQGPVGSPGPRPAPDFQPAAPVLDEGAVADFLLKKKYFLSALELHQELQEGNNGMHSISSLNKFFNDSNTYASLVKRVADEEAKNKAQSYGGKTASVQSPFVSDGLQPALAARDQKIALLEYRLRCTEEEATAAKKQLRDTVQSLQNQGGKDGSAPALTNGPSGPGSSNSNSSGTAGADEDGGRITEVERRTLNALIRRYLLARGYKATAVALAEEVSDQDLSGRTDDTALLALPGTHRRGTGSGVPVLSLLGMHRQRIAPIQALAAENQQRNDSEIAGLRAELRAVHEQLEASVSELAASKTRLAEVEAELMHAKTVRGQGQGQQAANQGQGQNGTGQGPAPSQSSAPTPAPAQPNPASFAGKISLSHAPSLLRAVVEGLPTLARITVTKQRAALAPLLSHATAAEPTVEGRRSLILSFLGLLRRPTYAERQLLKVQWGVLAGKLGSSGAEQEMLPEVLLLAKTGKSKEKRALAAALAGILASHISDKRVDTLLACLADLADSRHAVVRVGVVEGLASIASTLADRWSKAVANGIVPGQGSAVEAFASRQYASVEETMWRTLMGGDKRGHAQMEDRGHGHGYSGSSGIGGAGEDATGTAAELEELAQANEAEHPLTVPAVLALAGTPAGEAAEKAAAAAAAAAAKTGKGPLAERAAAQAQAAGGGALPAAWSQPPTSVLAGACTSLVPVLLPWAYRLGALWGRVLPGWLGLLEETLYTPGPGAPVITPAPGTPAPSVRATAWHLRRVQAVLQVLGAASVRIRQALLDSGYTIQYTGPADAAPAPPAADGADAVAAPAAAAAALANGANDYIYEVFDNASGAAVGAFPTEVPLAAAMRNGQAVYPPGVNPAQAAQGQLPAQQRQALVLAALLRGTASVRRRKNGHVNPATWPAGTPVWQILPDQQATVAWPALQWSMRTLVPTLLRQAALVNRSSGAGRDIVDCYADALSSLGTAMGPAFTSYAIRPVFLRAFGIPSELPPAMPAPGALALAPPVPGLPQPLVSALQPGSGGRTPSLLPLAQILLGMPATGSAEARKAAMSAAQGNFSGPINYASAGPKGGDWPYVLPELGWLAKDSPENPSHAGKTAAALQAMVAARQAELASAPPPTAPGVPLAIITEKLGGSWNADSLLALFGSGVLACPALASRDHLDHALRSLVGLVAGNKGGWGGMQSSLEDVVLRAGGGSAHGAAGAAAAGAAGKDGAKGGGGKGQAAGTAGQTATATPLDATASERAAAAAANLAHVLKEVLPRMAGATDPATRTCAAGLLRSCIPLLQPGQIAEPWLPTVKKLFEDGQHPAVQKAGVRALATIYSTPACNDPEVRGLVNGEVTGLLANGPKEVVLEVLRSLMRAVPVAPPATRDGFILDRLLEMTERVAGAAEAGSQAMRELASQIGDVDAGDVHSAAAAALRATRDAAIQNAAPWPGATADDLEDTTMALLECMRAYGSVICGPDTTAMLRDAGSRLLRAEILEASYRDMMRGTLAALFPAVHQGGLLSPHGHGQGGQDAYSGVADGGADDGQGGGHYGHDGSHGGGHGHYNSTVAAHGDILADFAAEREAGIAPPSFDSFNTSGHGGANGGLDDSFDQAAKALGSSLTSALKGVSGVSLKGTMGGMGMGGLSMGGMGLGGMGGMSLKGFGLGGSGGGAAGGGANPAGGKGDGGHGPSAGATMPAPRRPSRAGEEAGPATFSLDSFAATAPAATSGGGGGSRRPSGAGGAAGGPEGISMSSFMGGPAASGAGHPPAHPPGSGGGEPSIAAKGFGLGSSFVSLTGGAKGAGSAGAGAAGSGGSSSEAAGEGKGSGGGLLKGMSLPGVGGKGAGSSAAAPAKDAGAKDGGSGSHGLGISMGRGFGDRMRKLGDAMEKAAEKMMD